MAMATAAPIVGGDPTPQTGAGTTPTLRRATYVKVDELIKSTYDIDLQRLSSELAKLRTAKEEKDLLSSQGDGGENISPSSSGGDGPPSVTKPPVKNAWAATNLSVLPGGPLRAPLPGKHTQSRLQPPRDGYNLCL